MSRVVEVNVPDIGDFAEVEVIEVLVQAGDTVALEQSLITVESDKASMEIPSSVAGQVEAVLVKVGDKVSEGTPLARVKAGADAANAAGSSAPAPLAPAPQPAPMPMPAPAGAASAGAAASQAASASGPAASAAKVTVEVPDIGDFSAVEVIEVLVSVGDRVSLEQSLITVESDKASMEIPSSAAGVVSRILVSIGDQVSKGSAVLELQAEGAAASAPAAAPAVASRAEPAPAPAKVSSANASSAVPAAASAVDTTPGRSHPVPHNPTDIERVVKPHASPSVRAYARELGVDLMHVSGTGPKQRITRDDVSAFVKRVVSQATSGAAASGSAAKTGGGDGSALGLIPWPKVDFAKFGPIERRDLPRIKKISAANLHRNWVMIPHVTNHDEADVTDLEDFRKRLNAENEKSGAKVTMLAFLVKACVSALKKFPEFNASLDGEQLVLKQYYHIGVAADTPNGLVVPVIRDADQKGVMAIAAEMGALAKKAREGKLAPGEMQGGTFSISSLGGIGGTYFTPIINAPEVAILGVCRSDIKPVWDGSQFTPRLILPLSLSWDHRVIDGAAAARFNAHLGQVLADFRRTML